MWISVLRASKFVQDTQIYTWRWGFCRRRSGFLVYKLVRSTFWVGLLGAPGLSCAKVGHVMIALLRRGVPIFLLSACGAAEADLLTFSDPSGLSGEAEFTLVNPTTVQIRLTNTSTGVPVGFDSSDQLLTGITWDSGEIGINAGDPAIVGGTAAIGALSQSVNFSTGSYGPGSDIGGEWGFGNSGGSGGLPNMVSGNTAGVVAFGGANLDGPASLNGPQGGLVASPAIVNLGGLGAIQNEIVVEIMLDQAISDLSELLGNGAQIEFGSDAAFIYVPAPGTLALLSVPFAVCAVRRRR